MKHYDKNSLIGFLLMAIILIVFNTFFFNSESTNTSQKQPIQDKNINSKSQNEKITSNDSNFTKDKKSQNIDTSNLIVKTKIHNSFFSNSIKGEETFHSLENEKLKIVISNKEEELFLLF